MILAFDLGPITRIGSRVIAVLGRNFHEIFQVGKSHGDYTEVSADRIISDVNQGANWMDIYNSLFSKNCMLNEQVARQVFEILPEEGPMMVILDRAGHFWPSDSERFEKLGIEEGFFKGLCDKIDDGAEPVVSQRDDYSVIAAQLATEQTNCGYVAVILPQQSAESMLANIDLLEIVLNQIALTARLIERNNSLYEHQVKQYRAYPQTVAASN